VGFNNHRADDRHCPGTLDIEMPQKDILTLIALFLLEV